MANTQADHDLQEAYEEERKKREQLELQNEQLKKALVELQTVSEQEEEMITNTVNRHIIHVTVYCHLHSCLSG